MNNEEIVLLLNRIIYFLLFQRLNCLNIFVLLAARVAQERFEANKSRRGSPTKISRDGTNVVIPETNGCASKMAFLDNAMEHTTIKNGSTKNDNFSSEMKKSQSM